MAKFLSILSGYAVLLYLLILASLNLYEPTRNFNLPGLLWFTHLMLLYIHEAGHLIFSLFGRTLYTLGGSLNQILIPLVWFVIAKREESKLSDVALFFTGISIMDVSIYVKDAGLLQLPLIGGLSKSHHDWANLMRDWGTMEYSYTFGEILFWCGFIACSFGLVNGIRKALLEYKENPTEISSYD